MKRLVIVLLVLAALGYLAKTSDFNKSGRSADGDAAPEVITDPVYAEVRFHTDIHDRSFQAVALAKTVNEADCKHGTDQLVQRITNPQGSGRLKWTLVSSECSKTIDSRAQHLFENKRTFVNYVSGARGASDEREERLIIWGVTAEEGDMICEVMVPAMQKQRQGAVKCIQALPTQ